MRFGGIIHLLIYIYQTVIHFRYRHPTFKGGKTLSSIRAPLQITGSSYTPMYALPTCRALYNVLNAPKLKHFLRFNFELCATQLTKGSLSNTF